MAMGQEPYTHEDSDFGDGAVSSGRMVLFYDSEEPLGPGYQCVERDGVQAQTSDERKDGVGKVLDGAEGGEAAPFACVAANDLGS